MGKIISLLKRACKAYCNAYAEANTIKMSDGKVAYISGSCGMVYVA